MLMYSVSQEFEQSTVRTTCFPSMLPYQEHGKPFEQWEVGK